MIVGGKRHEQKCLDPKPIFATKIWAQNVVCRTRQKLDDIFFDWCIHVFNLHILPVYFEHTLPEVDEQGGQQQAELQQKGKEEQESKAEKTKHREVVEEAEGEEGEEQEETDRIRDHRHSSRAYIT